MRNAKIISSGAYAPSNNIPNSYFDELLEINVSEWLEEVVHIKNRRWVSDNQSTSDIAYEAAKECIDASNIDVKDIDLIILATDTPDYISPSTASVLQNKLGCINAGSFDMNTACAGFVTALDTASKFIKADKNYNNVLVIGAYVMSKFLDKTDKKTVTLFADGAGAVILQATENMDIGYQTSQLKTMGQYAEWMGIYGGGTQNPISESVIKNNDHRLKFVKKFPPEINPQTWSQMALHMNKTLDKKPEDINQYFVTQININSIWQTMDILGEPREKAHTIMHDYGYTGSACIPMAFHDAWKNGKVKEGDLVYFIGSGGGLAFASAAFIL